MTEASPLLVFLHTPKCGGTTLDRAGRSIVGRNTGRYFRASRLPGQDPADLSPEERRRIVWLSGHFGFGDPLLDLFDRDRLHLTTVRRPLDRIRSYFAYQKAKAARDPTERRARIALMTLDEFGDRLARSSGQLLDGDLCGVICGTPDFAAARERLQSDAYLFAVTVDRVEAASEMLFRALAPDQPVDFDRHLNASDSQAHSFSDDVASRLGPRVQADQDLYDWVADRQANWLVEAEARLAALAKTGFG